MIIESKLRHNDGSTSKSVLEIYAILAIRTFRLKTRKHKDYTHQAERSPEEGAVAKGENIGITCGN